MSLIQLTRHHQRRVPLPIGLIIMRLNDVSSAFPYPNPHAHPIRTSHIPAHITRCPLVADAYRLRDPAVCAGARTVHCTFPSILMGVHSVSAPASVHVIPPAKELESVAYVDLWLAICGLVIEG
ncbi:hypothetical protein BJ912DRAFT_1059899 [Pholiota molesta]|nr:hypothetical protein BJ912DRAFT_1059899 [Pholiota molesta]